MAHLPTERLVEMLNEKPKRGRPRKTTVDLTIDTSSLKRLNDIVEVARGHLITADQARTPVAEVPPWMVYMADRICSAPFVPYDLDFDLQCPEIAAHLSLDAYLAHYMENEGEFWATISMQLKPQVIVEIGTAFGIRTNLIGKLNPQAVLYSIDNLSPYPLNDLRVETGYIARLNKTPFYFLNCNSTEAIVPRPANLIFIDGDHSSEAVLADTQWAWRQRQQGSFCIVWDDFDAESVRTPVRAFCAEHGLLLKVFGRMAYVEGF